jgi:hypothetical protein
LVLAVAVGCGLNVEATGSFDSPEAGSNEGGGRDAGDSAVDLEGGVDATSDARVDAEATRPDAGVPFVPSHIQPVYSLTAGDITINDLTEINTTNRTIKIGSASPIVAADIVYSPIDNVAVWSVGALTVNAKLTVTGDYPLVIVAARNVEIHATIFAYGAYTGGVAVPGPGGSLPASGAGKGSDGAKPAANDASGGGGAGHAVVGGLGGDDGPAKGGLGGLVTSDTGELLVGGSGGGNAGGFVLGTCGDRGRGGAGGGAVQISTVGKLLIGFAGGFDVGGGNGKGGCKNNGTDNYTGGGGGGAGGTVVLEAAGALVLQAGAVLEASGGGGGEGGDNNSFGFDGAPGGFPSGSAPGGFGTNGGNGGDGGVAPQGPGAGVNGDTGGGGGGAYGRVLLRTRGATNLTDLGATILAERFADPTF